jgi:prolyl 4-hydroxylase
MMAPRLTTIIEYLLLSIPLYIFVGSPLLKVLAPSIFGVSDTENYQSFEKTDSLVLPDENLACAPHNYNVRILSREPLVVYIDGFLGQKEAEHLVNVAYVVQVNLLRSNC